MPLGEGRQSGQRTAEKSIEGRANTLPNGLFALFWRCWEGGQSGHAKNNLAEAKDIFLCRQVKVIQYLIIENLTQKVHKYIQLPIYEKQGDL